MKTIVKEINLYKFHELTNEAKENALQELYDINVDYPWWQLTFEDANNIGLKITSFDLDRHRHAKGKIEISALECAKKIVSDHGDKCDTYALAKTFIIEYTSLQEQLDKLDIDIPEQYDKCYELETEQEKLIEQFELDLLEAYSMILQRECDYLMSNEAIISTIEANDYDFTEEGVLY